MMSRKVKSVALLLGLGAMLMSSCGNVYCPDDGNRKVSRKNYISSDDTISKRYRRKVRKRLVKRLKARGYKVRSYKVRSYRTKLYISRKRSSGFRWFRLSRRRRFF